MIGFVLLALLGVIVLRICARRDRNKVNTATAAAILARKTGEGGSGRRRRRRGESGATGPDDVDAVQLSTINNAFEVADGDGSGEGGGEYDGGLPPSSSRVMFRKAGSFGSGRGSTTNLAYLAPPNAGGGDGGSGGGGGGSGHSARSVISGSGMSGSDGRQRGAFVRSVPTTTPTSLAPTTPASPLDGYDHLDYEESCGLNDSGSTVAGEMTPGAFTHIDEGDSGEGGNVAGGGSGLRRQWSSNLRNPAVF